MSYALRFFLPLIFALSTLAIALTPLTSNLIGQWFQRDLQLRALLVSRVIAPTIENMVRTGDTKQITDLFNSISQDERVLSVGLCDQANRLRFAGSAWPAGVICGENGDTQEIDGGNKSLLVSTFPLSGARPDRLVILQDVSFIKSRSAVAKLYLMGFLAIVSLVAAIVTMLTAHLTLRGWVKTVRGMIANREEFGSRDPNIAPIIREIRQLIRDLDISEQTSSNIRADWSPDVLRRVLSSELPGCQVIVVSNREPYIHNHDAANRIVVQRPASGMVTALEPIMRACGGTWIAHGSGTADRAAVDKGDVLQVPPHAPAYTLRRIWLSDAEQNGYYYGLANEGLWPLCHVSFVRPIFRESDWLAYREVNQKFADAVVKESTGESPVVLVQDYHLALAPEMIRQKLPKAIIVTFWHIPWPNAEILGIFPWREELLSGLLGSSIIGFHTQLHCNNFIDSADRFIESHIDREDATISVSGHKSLVRPYPISIAWPPDPSLLQGSVEECRIRIFQQLRLKSDSILFVGVERFDFTKGIPDRFRAVEILLERHPELIGRFVLLQVAAPTRSKLSAYEEIKHESEGVADKVNSRFGRRDYQPILLAARHHEPEEVFELFRAADACIVNSLHDGMNLVAKEFVAARDDEQGVLVLSTFAGASRELMEAVLVNPYDGLQTADALYHATRMPREEQQRRMQLMRRMVSENNIYYWAGRMLLDAARLRKRQQLESSITKAAMAGRLSP